MTSSTETTTPVSALPGQAELFDLDAELIELTDADAATSAAAQASTVAAELAASAARAARKEQRTMATGWVMLVAGLAIAMGSLASIAWHDSVAANGPGTSVETTTTP